MKKATKKLGILLLTIVFVCGLLAGCARAELAMMRLQKEKQNLFYGVPMVHTEHNI